MTTKADRTRHSRESLSPSQLVAAQLVAGGMKDDDAATVAGVTRQTVNGWRNDDLRFIAEVNRVRRGMFSESRERLRALSLKAVDTLDRAMEGGSVPAAVAVLKAVATIGEPEAPTTTEGLLRVRAEELVDQEDAATPMNLIDSLTTKSLDNRAERVAEAMDRIRGEGR